MITLTRRHPYTLTYIEEHCAFFDQERTLLEPTIRHDGFSTINPEKPSNFGQAPKWPDQVNWIKSAFAKNDKNSNFGLLDVPFHHANLPSKTRVIWSILSPCKNSISENIYHYFPCNCANGETQVKVIDFDQSSSPYLAAPTPYMRITG